MLGVASATAQSVRGRVLDDSTGTPVAGARVDLLDLGGRVVHQGVTLQDGAFRLSAARPGQYRLIVRRLGYVPRTTPLLDLVASDTVAVAVRLTTAAVTLAPVTIVGRGGTVTVFNPYLERLGYYDREVRYGREGLGLGTFLDGDKLRPTAARVVDLLRDVPGIRIVSAGGTKAYVGGRWSSCRPDIFVNGTFVGRSGSDNAEEALPAAAAVAAIEVYPGGGCACPVSEVRIRRLRGRPDLDRHEAVDWGSARLGPQRVRPRQRPRHPPS
jgi:hypothetical protein